MAESKHPWPPGALPLDGGATVGRSQVGVGCVAAVVALLAVVFIFVGVLVVVASLLDGGAAGFVAGAFFLALAIGTLVVLSRWVRRSRAWLEGTHLVVRGPFGTGRCDLATARVGIDSVAERTSVSTYNPSGGGFSSTSVPTGRRIPRLVVRDGTTGQLIRLSLRMARGGMLPPAQLRALADVISTGPRPQPDAQDAQQLAASLRALADNPLSGHL